MMPQVLLLVVVLAAAGLYLPSSPGVAAGSKDLQITPQVDTPVDLAAGEQVYAKCLACHSPDRDRTGPHHCGLIGRVSGTAPGFTYSDAMKAAQIHWTAETLNTFLQSPMTQVPGTTMGFAGVADPVKRRNLIAWLATLSKDSPLCSSLQSASESN